MHAHASSPCSLSTCDNTTKPTLEQVSARLVSLQGSIHQATVLLLSESKHDRVDAVLQGLCHIIQVQGLQVHQAIQKLREEQEATHCSRDKQRDYNLDLSLLQVQAVRPANLMTSSANIQQNPLVCAYLFTTCMSPLVVRLEDCGRLKNYLTGLLSVALFNVGLVRHVQAMSIVEGSDPKQDLARRMLQDDACTFYKASYELLDPLLQLSDPACDFWFVGLAAANNLTECCRRNTTATTCCAQLDSTLDCDFPVDATMPDCISSSSTPLSQANMVLETCQWRQGFISGLLAMAPAPELAIYRHFVRTSLAYGVNAAEFVGDEDMAVDCDEDEEELDEYFVFNDALVSQELTSSDLQWIILSTVVPTSRIIILINNFLYVKSPPKENLKSMGAFWSPFEVYATLLDLFFNGDNTPFLWRFRSTGLGSRQST